MTVTQLINSRRTIRKFEQKQISQDLLKKYVNAARIAPSAANIQPLKYVAVQSKEMVDKIFPLLKWAGYLAGEYNPKENERPTAYIVICADEKIRKNGYDMDVGASVENIILSALEDGLGACWIGSVDRDELKKLLNLESNIQISCVVALGYLAESPKEVEKKEDIKYYLDSSNTLCVPKRSINEVLIDIV